MTKGTCAYYICLCHSMLSIFANFCEDIWLETCMLISLLYLVCSTFTPNFDLGIIFTHPSWHSVDSIISLAHKKSSGVTSSLSKPKRVCLSYVSGNIWKYFLQQDKYIVSCFSFLLMLLLEFETGIWLQWIVHASQLHHIKSMLIICFTKRKW